jgi:hypothetical protein
MKSEIKVEPRFKIGLTGEYNAGVNSCPECDHSPSPLMAHAIGIADAPIGTVVIIECPKCFTKWYFHIREYADPKIGHYSYFKEFIKNGMNIHFNEKGEKT